MRQFGTWNEVTTMTRNTYNVRIEYGDIGGGCPWYDEYKNISGVTGDIKGAFALAMLRFYTYRSNKTLITKVIMEKA